MGADGSGQHEHDPWPAALIGLDLDVLLDPYTGLGLTFWFSS